VIIPTDDERLKIIVIPVNALTNQNGPLTTQVQSILKNCEMSHTKTEEVWVPSFKVEAHMVNKEVTGVTLGDDKHVKECQ
jgi:hypothetical protein